MKKYIYKLEYIGKKYVILHALQIPWVKTEEMESSEIENNATKHAQECYITEHVQEQDVTEHAQEHNFTVHVQESREEVHVQEHREEGHVKEHGQEEHAEEELMPYMIKPIKSSNVKDKKQNEITPPMRCTRCGKYKHEKKGSSWSSKVGKKYIRVFLKVEQGWSEEQINSANICNACRCTIYFYVFKPGHRSPSKSVFPRSQLAAKAAKSVPRQPITTCDGKDDRQFGSMPRFRCARCGKNKQGKMWKSMIKTCKSEYIQV